MLKSFCVSIKEEYKVKKLMKVLSCAVIGFVFAAGLFAQDSNGSGNLLFTGNMVIPKEKIDFAGPMKKGKAPSGKDAIIVKAGDKNGNIEYRWRIDFKTPVSLKGYTKMHFTWEALDPDIKTAGGANINVSILTLCKDDNKLLRSDKTWVADKRDHAQDKRSFLMAPNDGFSTFDMVLDLTKDAQTWTDTTVETSTKQMTGIEFFIGLGDEKKASAFKGMAVTSIWFE